MMTEPSKSVLSREQIRQAIAVLRQEQEAHPISPAQRKHLFWYGISLAVFFGAFFLLPFLHHILSEGARQRWADLLLIFFLLLLGGSFLSIVWLFLLNMKLIWQTWREFRLAFRTKLWQLVARARTGRRWPRRLMIGIGAVLLVFFLFGMWEVPTVGLPLAVALLVFFLLLFARRRLDVLRNADQLVAFLTKLDVSESPAGIDQIAIPTDIFKEIGGIEDVHIQRRRAMAISEFRDSGHGYALLKSRAMIADIVKLDEATQLRVEARIAELTSDFPPPDALRESGGVWRVPVTETPYEIVCRQDEAARRIELLSLGQGDGKSTPRRTTEAPHG